MLKPALKAGFSETGATGLEPATSGVTGRRSNQLSYAPERLEAGPWGSPESKASVSRLPRRKGRGRCGWRDCAARRGTPRSRRRRSTPSPRSDVVHGPAELALHGAAGPAPQPPRRWHDPVRMRRLLALFVLAALVVPTGAAAAERTVSVTATVERQVPNDTAEVHFAVSKERPGRAAALRIVALRLRAVIAAAQAVPGVGPGDVTTGSISVRRAERGKRPVYRASGGVTVVTHLPEGAGDLLSAGVAAGATSSRGPTFLVGDREAAYDAALVEALERAKAKAGMLARAAGASLGPAITISESGTVTPFEGADATEPAAKCVAAP